MFTIWKALKTVLCNFKAVRSADNSSITFSAIKQKGNGADTYWFLIYKNKGAMPLK